MRQVQGGRASGGDKFDDLDRMLNLGNVAMSDIR